jgi:hypothetical protein
MRISDRVLKSTVFLGKKEGARFSPAATAFLVSHKAGKGDAVFLYLVTCMHAVVGKVVAPRFNTMTGGCKVLPSIPAGDWYFHPDATRFIDVAVAQIGFSLDPFDVAHIRLEDFCSTEILTDRDVGIGDELFFPSLFAYHAGTGRNLPVMRAATLAGMPIEPVETKSGPMQAYLIEGRSISGHSGSPVFINFLAPRSYYADRTVGLPHPMQSQAYRLLGLIHGFIRADDVGIYITDQPPKQESLWVNTGISLVIPAAQISETILQDDLEAVREDALKEARRSGEAQQAGIGGVVAIKLRPRPSRRRK